MNTINILNKSLGEYIMMFLIALILIYIYLSLDVYNSKYELCNVKMEKMMNIDNSNEQQISSWSRNECPYIMNKTLEDELNNGKIYRNDKNWNLYFPCSYDNTNKEVNSMPIVNNAKYFILENCDEIVAKDLLWKHISSHYGIDIAKSLMPNSYVLYDDQDLKRFTEEYDTNKLYIMKKNIQRQEGLKIINNKNDILNGSHDGYILVQELLQDPYIISGRKTNMRFYVLVVCKGNNMDVYIYNDGFMYYTKDLFVKGSLEEDSNITTGYIDRQVYIDNPLTHQDLKTYLDNPNRQNLSSIETHLRNQEYKISEIYFSRIYHLLRQIFVAFSNKINKNINDRKFNDTNTTFQLFGVDIAVNDNLNPTIMEVNKGPDLDSKDEKDSELKHKIIKDVLKLIDVINIDDTFATFYGNSPYKIFNEKVYKDDLNGFIRILKINNGNINSDSFDNSNCF